MDENSSPPHIPNVAGMAEINPRDHASVRCIAEGKWFNFDYASSAAADGIDVFTSAFMPGRWRVAAGPNSE